MSDPAGISGLTHPMVAFCAARLDEREAVATAVSPGDWDEQHADDEPGYYTLAAENEQRWNQQQHSAACGYRMSCFSEPCSCTTQAWVLADVAAKRAILALHDHGPLGSDADSSWFCYGCCRTGPCPTVRHLAAIDTDHPDYQQEWKP